MGTLIRRSNGVYYGIFCRGRKRIWKSLRTDDYVNARAYFQELSGEFKAKKECRMSSLRDHYKMKANVDISESTLGIYDAAISNFIRHCGDKLLKSVSPVDVEQFKASRIREVKAVTLNIDLRTLRAAFNEALRLKLIEESPFEGAKLARVEDQEAVFLTKREVDRLLQVIHDESFKQLVLFSIYTMARLGELIHVDWSDVDLTRRIVHIRNKKGFRVKGGKPRWVPMNEWVFALLSNSEDRTGLIFKNHRGQPLIGGSVSHRFKKYVRCAELDDRIHFHTLRHTGMSFLANDGVPIPFIQRIAGHSSPLTTQIYTHLEDQNLSSAINRMPSFN